MADLTEQIEAVLVEHLHVRLRGCLCGFEMPQSVHSPSVAHRAHVAQQIAALEAQAKSGQTFWFENAKVHEEGRRKAEAALADERRAHGELRARVEALAIEWELCADAATQRGYPSPGDGLTFAQEQHAHILRDLLAEDGAP